MEQLEINEIIRKYFVGEIASEEAAKLETWLAKSEENMQAFEALEKVWLEKSSEPELVTTDALIDKIWYEGVEKEKENSVRVREINYFIKAAAVVLIFIATPFIVYKAIQKPASEFATPKMIVKENPGGQKSQIVLPDGSVVWLNAASSISYSPGFDANERNVALKGEAYFEVTSNPSKPFVVKSENIWVTALGTSFNVQAYSDQNDIVVSLLTGKAKVQNRNPELEPVFLLPGNELTYNKSNGDMSRQSFNSIAAIGWKDGILVFDSDEYPDAIRKLSRWYGIKIITMGVPPADWKLTTSFKNEALANILRSLRFGKEFKYELNKEKLIISFE